MWISATCLTVFLTIFFPISSIASIWRVCFSSTLKLQNGDSFMSGVLAARTYSTMGKKEPWKVSCRCYKAKNKPQQDNRVYPQIKTESQLRALGGDGVQCSAFKRVDPVHGSAQISRSTDNCGKFKKRSQRLCRLDKNRVSF